MFNNNSSNMSSLSEKHSSIATLFYTLFIESGKYVNVSV